MEKFLTPEEMYVKRNKQKRVIFASIIAVIICLFAIIPLLSYHL